MGEARQRRPLRERLLAHHPNCIFCGGQTPATTVEHLPPRGLFRGRQRPQGLEFASCHPCNNGTRHADLVASFMSRVMPLDDHREDIEDFGGMLRLIGRQIPGLLDEMHMSRASMKLAGKGLPPQAREHLVRAGGPLMTHYMQMFSVKLGQALHFEETSQIVPPQGGIYIRWFSNVDQLRGKLPDDFLALMPEGRTLQQGKFSVERQFQYTSWAADDGSIGAHFATFGFSFAVLALVTMDRSTFEGRDGFNKKHFAPGEILRLAVPGSVIGAARLSSRNS